MECVICTETVDSFMVNMDCLHGCCVICAERIPDKSKCHYCRTPQKTPKTEMNVDEYAFFNDGTINYPPFEVLFTRKHLRVYETARKLLRSKWSAKADYLHDSLCRVCVLQKTFFESVDMALLYLFYSCSTITRTTILDAMISLCMTYGWKNCKEVSPKDVYFHFFLNHCSTPRVGTSEADYSTQADFVCDAMNALVFDCAEIDAIANFVNIQPPDGSPLCDCNNCHTNLPSHSKKTSYSVPTKEDNSNKSNSLFIPNKGKYSTSKGTDKQVVLNWDNSYKWVHYDFQTPDNVVSDAAKGDDDEEGGGGTLLVDCLKIFHECSVCDWMMDYSNRKELLDLDEAITAMGNLNIVTAVHIACTERRYPEEKIKYLTSHYTSSACRLNSLRFIHFYSLVKQPSSLLGSASVEHMILDLFPNKRSFLCPMYHLSCICERIVNADSSQLKKTKRNAIQKWASKFMSRHLSPSQIIASLLENKGIIK